MRSSSSTSVEMTGPVTVGTSSSEKRMGALKHSASSDRSIKLTEAPAFGVRSATAFMPRACRSLSLIRSFTVMPSSWMDGKDSTGTAFLTGAASRSLVH